MSDEISVTELSTKSQRLGAITLTGDNTIENNLRIYGNPDDATMTIVDSNNAKYSVDVNDLIEALNAITTLVGADTIELNTIEGTYSVK